MNGLLTFFDLQNRLLWVGLIGLLMLFSFFSSGSFLELAAVVAEVLCIWLLAKERISTFFFGCVSGVLFFFLFLSEQLYGSMSIQVYFIVMNLIGFVSWKKEREKAGMHRAKSLPIKGWLLLLLVLLLGTVVLNTALLTWTNAESTLLDSVLTIGSMVASFLTIQKYMENWLVWILLEVCYLVLYASHGLYVACLMAALLLLLNTQGYIQWKKTMNLPKKETD